MSGKVEKAFEQFLRTRRDHRDGLTARQQLWTAFEAGAQFTLDEIRERTGLSQPTQETIPAPEETSLDDATKERLTNFAKACRKNAGLTTKYAVRGMLARASQRR